MHLKQTFVLKLLDRAPRYGLLSVGVGTAASMAETCVLLLHMGKIWGILRCMHVFGAPAYPPSLTVGSVVLVHAVKRSGLKSEKDWIFIL